MLDAILIKPMVKDCCSIWSDKEKLLLSVSTDSNTKNLTNNDAPFIISFTPNSSNISVYADSPLQ